MSAFQDFGPLSERRKAEIQQRHRKRFVVAASSASILLIVAVVGVVAVTYKAPSSSDSSGNGGGGAASGGGGASHLHSGSKMVEAICSSTNYKQLCQSSLSPATNSSGVPSAKALVKAAVTSIVGAVNKALDHAESIKSDDPAVKAAIAECKELFGYAMEDLQGTINHIDAQNLGQLSDRAHDFSSWLSAAMTYQRTCIRGFPEGDIKDRLAEAADTARQLTSNALAIVGEVGELLSELNIDISGIAHRRLLFSSSAAGTPDWVDRRTLKESRTGKYTPNVTVAKDGSGNFKTINDALNAMPKKYSGRYVIYVKSGVYAETVNITKHMLNVTMYGDGSLKTIVTGSKNFVDGVRTFGTATFAVMGDGFVGQAMGFRNTAGAVKHQAVALRVQSEWSVFLNCRMEGYQDTLYAMAKRQFYRGCTISGTIDFIFGDATAVFQNCVFVVRRPMSNQQNIITAHGRSDPKETTGYAMQNCRVTADPAFAADRKAFKTYLARPWEAYSRTVFMESDLGDFIDPAGYMPWDNNAATLKTLFYGEYRNIGPAANTAGRVKWPGVKAALAPGVAAGFTVDSFIHGGVWVKSRGAPVQMGL